MYTTNNRIIILQQTPDQIWSNTCECHFYCPFVHMRWLKRFPGRRQQIDSRSSYLLQTFILTLAFSFPCWEESWWSGTQLRAKIIIKIVHKDSLNFIFIFMEHYFFSNKCPSLCQHRARNWLSKIHLKNSFSKDVSEE